MKAGTREKCEISLEGYFNGSEVAYVLSFKSKLSNLGKKSFVYKNCEIIKCLYKN